MMTLNLLWCLHSMLLLMIVHGKATQKDQFIYKEDFDNKICWTGAIFSYRTIGTLIQCLSVCNGDGRCKGVVFRANLCNGCSDFINMDMEAGTRLYKKASCIDHVSGTRCVKKILTVENGLHGGQWSDNAFCLLGRYAVGYRLKVEDTVGVIDDTAVNAVELVCQKSDERARPSISGPNGNWQDDVKTCSPQDAPSVLKAFQMQVEHIKADFGPFNLIVDRSAVNYIRFKCGLLEVNGYAETIEVPPGYGLEGEDGDWSISCDVGQGVCGLSIRVDMGSPDRLYDDTGLNDMILYCC